MSRTTTIALNRATNRIHRAHADPGSSLQAAGGKSRSQRHPQPSLPHARTALPFIPPRWSTHSCPPKVTIRPPGSTLKSQVRTAHSAITRTRKTNSIPIPRSAYKGPRIADHTPQAPIPASSPLAPPTLTIHPLASITEIAVPGLSSCPSQQKYCC